MCQRGEQASTSYGIAGVMATGVRYALEVGAADPPVRVVIHASNLCAGPE